MNKSTARLSILLAGLLAVAGVQAQSTSASGSSDLPPKAGEASTQTHGVPNAATSNGMATEAPKLSKDAIREDAHGMSGASATTDVPGKAGEASTQTRGVPNAATTNTMGTEAPKLSKDAIREDAHGMSGASASTSVPGKAGEATTMARGNPNANDQQVAKSRDEVRNELLNRRSMYEAARKSQMMGNRGATPDMGTPK